MSDKPELKSCPFCGNEAEITPLKHEETGVELEGVRCKQCGAMCLGQDNWNSRADLASPSEVYDRIQGYIRVIQEKDNLIADLAKPSEWINVDDRLPIFNEKVFTYSEGGIRRISFLSNRYGPTEWDCFSDIIAWQPLPPPPTREDP